MKNLLITTIRCGIALMLALQVWVWLRYFGVLWANDSMELLESLYMHPKALKTTIEGFYKLLIPALVISYVCSGKVRNSVFILFATSLGVLFSYIYLLNISFFMMSFVSGQLDIYIVAGGFAGLTYAAIFLIPLTKHQSTLSGTNGLLLRRRLLGSIGVLAGSSGLISSLAGPAYIWKNRNNYIDIDLSDLKDGERITAELGDRPIWVIKRSPELIELLQQENSRLRDPNSKSSNQPASTKNNFRSIRPEYFVVDGLCTHLGCLPDYNPDSDGSDTSPSPGFYCACHGGRFDSAGRVFKSSPPPVNMAIPEHEFISDTVVRVYFPSLSERWGIKKAS